MRRFPGSRRRLGLAAGAALVFAATAAARLPLAPITTIHHLVAAPSPGPLGPEGVPIPKGDIFANVRRVKVNQTIDGVRCDKAEKVTFHIHSHLTIFANGKAAQIPYGIGIGPPVQGLNTDVGPFVTVGSCFMWLHTHASDGIIHIEAPAKQAFTLGQFFEIWGLPLSTTRVGPAIGTVTAFYNGKVWTGDPAEIPLGFNVQIQLDVGTPIIAPEQIKFPKSLGSTTGKPK